MQIAHVENVTRNLLRLNVAVMHKKGLIRIKYQKNYAFTKPGQDIEHINIDLTTCQEQMQIRPDYIVGLNNNEMTK